MLEYIEAVVRLLSILSFMYFCSTVARQILRAGASSRRLALTLF